jgi:copper(I)-binding protein
MMIKPALIATSVAALALSLSACQREAATTAKTTAKTDGGATASVEIRDAWCRPTPNGAQAAACYLTLEATGANRVTGVATPLAASAAIHDMTMEGGVMRMSEMADGLPLEAGKPMVLAPGGKHVMLMGLTGPLVAGVSAPLTLTFSATPAMTVQAAVRQPTEREAPGAH